MMLSAVTAHFFITSQVIASSQPVVGLVILAVAVRVFLFVEIVKINQNVFLCETGIIPVHFYGYDK